MSNEINPITPDLPVKENARNSVLAFFSSLFLSRIFSIFVGMFIGSGIVLKFNPELIMLKNKVVLLETENTNLKKEILNNMLIIKNSQGEIKNSVKLP